MVDKAKQRDVTAAEVAALKQAEAKFPEIPPGQGLSGRESAGTGDDAVEVEHGPDLPGETSDGLDDTGEAVRRAAEDHPSGRRSSRKTLARQGV